MLERSGACGIIILAAHYTQRRHVLIHPRGGVSIFIRAITSGHVCLQLWASLAGKVAPRRAVYGNNLMHKVVGLQYGTSRKCRGCVMHTTYVGPQPRQMTGPHTPMRASQLQRLSRGAQPAQLCVHPQLVCVAGELCHTAQWERGHASNALPLACLSYFSATRTVLPSASSGTPQFPSQKAKARLPTRPCGNLQSKL